MKSKVVIRRLPRSVTEEEFTALLHERFGEQIAGVRFRCAETSEYVSSA